MPIISRLLASAIASLFVCATTAHATPITQYASSVIGFSSQYTGTVWGANQILGAPNTNSYGDNNTAWSPLSRNGTHEWISVGFSTAVYATGSTIRETYGNGFVYQVDAIDTGGSLHTVWSGNDASAPGAPVNFSLLWTQTDFLVSGLKVYVDTDHNLSTWEEIDAIQLAGSTTPGSDVPEPASLALIGVGLIGAAAARRRQRR